MAVLEIINLPLLIGLSGLLLFFLWLGKYAERVDKKREKIRQSQVMRQKWQKMKRR